MHARLIRVKGSPEGAEERVAVFEREVVPILRTLPGFAGVVLAGDRETGESVSVTYWETPESSRQAEERMAEARGRITAELGLEVLGNEVFEITLLERRQPAQPGNCVRLTTVQGSADAFDAATGDLRERGLALASSLSGLRAMISGVNRETGRFMITSGWDTAADRQASEAATAKLRQQLLERLQPTSVEVENYEVYFAEITARAGVSG